MPAALGRTRRPGTPSQVKQSETHLGEDGILRLGYVPNILTPAVLDTCKDHAAQRDEERPTENTRPYISRNRENISFQSSCNPTLSRFQQAPNSYTHSKQEKQHTVVPPNPPRHKLPRIHPDQHPRRRQHNRHNMQSNKHRIPTRRIVQPRHLPRRGLRRGRRVWIGGLRHSVSRASGEACKYGVAWRWARNDKSPLYTHGVHRPGVGYAVASAVGSH